MRRYNLLHGTAITLGTLAGLSTASSAIAQTSATAQAANTTQEGTPAAPALAGATPSDAPAAPGIKSAAGADTDIIVTARKRNEKLLDVPISIQAFSREEIKTQGIADVQTLKDRAGFQFPPQVSNGPAGRFTGVLVFRGLQANSFGQQRDNSGSLFVDGIYISGGVQSVNTADVERIEVLKGPQSAYFGRSTFGGAVNFITRNPSDKLGVEVNFRGTARGTVDADASVEGSIIPGLMTGRFTAFVHKKVAQYHATDGGALGKEQTYGGVGTLYITPSSNSFIRLRARYQEDDDSAPSFGFLSANTYAAGACTGHAVPGFNSASPTTPLVLQRNYFCNGVPSLNSTGSGFITQNTVVPANYLAAIRATQNGSTGNLNVPFFSDVPSLDHFGLRRNTFFGSAQAGYTFASGAALAFSAGYNQQDSIDINDVDKTDTLLGFLDTVAFRTKDLTLDARFTSDPSKRIRLLLGASYYRGTIQNADIQNSLFSPTPSRGSNFQNDRARTPAVYGSVDFDILPTLTVTGEGRYQEDKIIVRNAAGVEFTSTSKDFLPRAILQFKPNKNTNAYISYARGTQPAAVNSGFAGLSALPFASQAIAYVQSVYPGIGIFSLTPTLDAYEIGFKQRLMDGNLNYTIAAYQNDWHHATTTSALFNPLSCFPPAVPVAQANTAACPLPAGGTSTVTPNDARIRGIEFAATARLSNLTIDFTADYKHAKWVHYANSGFNTFVGIASPGVYRGDGNYIGRVPKLSGTLAGTYRGKLTDGWNWYARGEGIYTGKAWDSDINLFQTAAYVRANASIGFARNNLTVELFSTNLFNDKHYDGVANTVELSGNFTQRALAVIPAQKREFGLRTQFKF